MSVCGLSSKDTLRAGLGATALALILYQLDGLKAVGELHIADPLHFVQGVFLGAGLTLMIGSRLRRRGSRRPVSQT